MRFDCNRKAKLTFIHSVESIHSDCSAIFDITHKCCIKSSVRKKWKRKGKAKNFGKQFFFLVLIFKHKMKLCFKESSSLSGSIENFRSEKAPSFNSVRWAPIYLIIISSVNARRLRTLYAQSLYIHFSLALDYTYNVRFHIRNAQIYIFFVAHSF